MVVVFGSSALTFFTHGEEEEGHGIEVCAGFAAAEPHQAHGDDEHGLTKTESDFEFADKESTGEASEHKGIDLIDHTRALLLWAVEEIEYGAKWPRNQAVSRFWSCRHGMANFAPIFFTWILLPAVIFVALETLLALYRVARRLPVLHRSAPKWEFQTDAGTWTHGALRRSCAPLALTARSRCLPTTTLLCVAYSRSPWHHAQSHVPRTYRHLAQVHAWPAGAGRASPQARPV